MTRILVSAILLLPASLVLAGPIDPGKPVYESLKPDLLYFNFDTPDDAYVESQVDAVPPASVEKGKVNSVPKVVDGPAPSFKKALLFDYGEGVKIGEQNVGTPGNHFLVQDSPTLNLDGTSFTLGAWVRVPEGFESVGGGELRATQKKTIIGKGGWSASYPGWQLQLIHKNNAWIYTLTMVDAAGNKSANKSYAILRDLMPGQWHHLGASFDAETLELVLTFDGNEVYRGIADCGPEFSTSPLLIGSAASQRTTTCLLKLTTCLLRPEFMNLLRSSSDAAGFAPR